MERPAYWNHNTAYYGWVKKNTVGCKRILDVGCGDGSLVRCLDDGTRVLVGIDADQDCIGRAMRETGSSHTQFICGRFEAYEPAQEFDAVVFVASIHHMDLTAAVSRAKSILAPGGMILIVGLARPSTLVDWAVEALRVIPCVVVSRLRRMRSSEDNHVPVSYRFPGMDEIRTAAHTLLPSHELRYGLFYRYLLRWKKQL